MNKQEQLQTVRDILSGDRFAMETGIVIDDFSEDGAVCHVDIGPSHCNLSKAVQGGVFFTLGDFCFAVASNAANLLGKTGYLAISLSSSISFVKQPRGKRLIATAKKVSAGHKTCLYQIHISDEMQTPCAEMLINGYTVKFELPKAEAAYTERE
ncbi:MAG: PaaI family thioesterase [Firmicutes bacterium]|nr:PaaI family thioesterase [Bacillota bacterium]